MMRGICGLFFDSDRIFASLAGRRKSGVFFLEELEIERVAANTVFEALKETAEILRQRISQSEKEHSFRLERVFLELPRDFNSKKVVEETVPLRKRKKVTSRDVTYIKKHLEDKFLDWDDFCVHNIPLGFEIGEARYSSPPLGLWARKVKMRSILTWVKDRTYREIEEIFDNINMSFGGFILPELSMLAVLSGGNSFDILREADQAVVSLDYARSFFVLRSSDGCIHSGEFDFGLKNILDELAGRFSLGSDLAREVFSRYIYFKEVPYFKEVTVKNESGYLKLSSQTMNFFVKNYIKIRITGMVREIEIKTGRKDFSISFIGRLSHKEGFNGFLKEFLPQKVVPPLAAGVSSSFGCLRYGSQRFLEITASRRNKLLQSFLDIYRDYF